MVCNLNVHVSWYMRERHIEVLVCQAQKQYGCRLNLGATSTL